MIMHYVYILRSKSTPGAIYIGETSDLNARLHQHNNLENYFSKRHAPWEVETYIAFTNKTDAKNFEEYLKVGSGNAFMKKRLLSKSFKEALAKFNNGRGGSRKF